MSDTPETDAEHARMQMGGFTMDFCRKLERDEAREKYDILATEHMLEVNKLCNERDEAREEIRKLRKHLAAANKGAEINAHINNSLTAKLAEAKRERDEAREQVKNLEDQRDLCMKTICRLEKELDQIRAVFGHGANDADWKPGTTIAEAVEKVMRERNEARKLACLYKDQFYAVSMPTVKPPKFSYEEGYIQ